MPIPTPGTVELIDVTMVSDETMKVQGENEARWFNRSRQEYLEQTRFTDTTDFRDLDKLLMLELMVFRWTQHLAAGVDYSGLPIDDTDLQRKIRDYNEQVIKLKESMGLSRRARDAAAADGDFSEWLSGLKRRAKEFGIHRNTQVTQALVLMNDLSAIVGSFDRSDEEERQKLGYPDEHAVMEWIREDMLPRFHAVDEAWRKSTQQYWTKD